MQKRAAATFLLCTTPACVKLKKKIVSIQPSKLVFIKFLLQKIDYRNCYKQSVISCKIIKKLVKIRRFAFSPIFVNFLKTNSFSAVSNRNVFKENYKRITFVLNYFFVRQCVLKISTLTSASRRLANFFNLHGN